MKSTFAIAASLVLVTLVSSGQNPAGQDAKVSEADVKKLAGALSAGTRQRKAHSPEKRAST